MTLRRSILVVAAHPDDEVLGCGGTIAHHSDQGDDVQVLIMAEGATSRSSYRDRSAMSDELQTLAQAARSAGQILGASNVELLNFPDNRLDSIPRLDIIKEIEKRISKFRPEIVYLHHVGDVNVDHRLLHDAVVTACRPIPDSCVKRLLSYEVASSTEWQPPNSAPAFQPNWYVDISDQFERKTEALAAYQSEMRPWPHARSLKALEHFVRWRGAQVGVSAAEAFCLLRNLV